MLKVKNIKIKRVLKELNKNMLSLVKVKKVIFFTAWIIYDTLYISIKLYRVSN